MDTITTIQLFTQKANMLNGMDWFITTPLNLYGHSSKEASMEFTEMSLRNIYKPMLMNIPGDITTEDLKKECLIDYLDK